MTLTYVDSCILIAAASGTPEVSKKAFAILDDPTREFASSIFLRMEVQPKAIFYKKPAAEFYNCFFKAVKVWATINEQLIEDALAEAIKLGLSAMDALHIVSAVNTDADELVTREKKTRNMFNTDMITVRNII